MKKNEFVSLVAERTDMSKKDTEKVIDAAFAAIGDLMMQGDKLVLSGLFKAGRTLKDKVNAK